MPFILPKWHSEFLLKKYVHLSKWLIFEDFLNKLRTSKNRAQKRKTA